MKIAMPPWVYCVLNASKVIVFATLLSLPPALAVAQQKPDIAGDFEGEIGGQDANLHLKIDAQGALSGTLDHLDLHSPWMFVLADVHWDGEDLSFSVLSTDAKWKGVLAKDGNSLSGTWMQRGSSWFVDFEREKFIPNPKPAPVDGIWLGSVPGEDHSTWRAQIVVKSDITGREYCTVDYLDAYYTDLECRNAMVKGNDFSFDVPAMGEHWSVTLSPDGNALTGNISVREIKGASNQAVSGAMNFSRQSALTPAKAKPVVAYDAPLPPSTAADLESVLGRDLASALKDGELAPATGGGVSIGVYEHGVRRVFSFGAGRPDSIYEIGSITKAFTGLMLAQMAAQGKVRLDEPVRELLPPGTVTKPAGQEITLLDLATRRSGLPPMPDNLNLANMEEPYADYHTAEMLAYIGKHGVANSNRASSAFGALGFGLLGVALANRAGTSYEALLKEQIAGPLGLNDTVIALTPEQKDRMIAGHDQFHGPAKAWDSDALAGAIAIRSTAGDMLTYLEANLHPEYVKPVAGFPGSKTLAVALVESHQPQTEGAGGMRLALGWTYQPETGNYWQNGATAEHSSYAFFNPKGDYAAVVLLNGSPGIYGSFVENLARHISQRLVGKPAIALGK